MDEAVNTPSIRAIVRDLLDCACSSTQDKAAQLISELEARERVILERVRLEANEKALADLQRRIHEAERYMREKPAGIVVTLNRFLSSEPL